jgi:hypothetical protein
VDPHDERLLVVAAVEDPDSTPFGQSPGAAPEEVVVELLLAGLLSSSLLGCLKEKTWQPAGFTPLITARIVPSLPAASIAWNTSSTAWRSWA